MGHSLGNNYGKFYAFQSKPVLLDLQFTVDKTNANGVTNVKGQGVEAVYMQSSATPSSSNPFVITTSIGYALIKLAYNYTRAYASSTVIRSPVTGSNIAINGSALTAGVPYQITDVGHGEAGTVTIAPVADTAGSLAGTWFKLFDNYGNTFAVWFSVSGVGSAPTVPGAILVQQSITTGDSAATIGAALVVTLGALLAAQPGNVSAPTGVFSFTAAGTTTVTLTSTQHSPYMPLPGAPSDGTVATGFTFAATKFVTNLSDWQHVGLPKGVEPAVGVSFVATATGFSTGGGSTGLVKALTVSGVDSMELIGDTNLSISPIPMGGTAHAGGWILVQFLLSGVLTAPVDSSIVKMTVLLEGATRVGGHSE